VLSGFVINGQRRPRLWGAVVGMPSFVLMIAICALEMLVAGIQAYVFALFTSLYINDAENLH
jgi:F-type H+-transporting ATPase subunit a